MAIIYQFPGAVPPKAGKPALSPKARARAARPEPQTTRRGKKEEEEETQRKAMLGKVHIKLNGNRARGILGLYATLPGFDEDKYRFALQERWGVNSSGAMDNKQLHSLLLYLSGLQFGVRAGTARAGGGTLSSKGEPAALKHDTSGLNREGLFSKIKAQLKAKAQADGKNISWGYALGILKRQSGGVTKDLDQAMPRQLDGIIAALDRDAARHGRARG